LYAVLVSPMNLGIRARSLRGLAAGVVAAAIVAGTVSGTCFDPNHEGALRAYDPSGSTTGVKGREDLVSATVQAGRGIAHPLQVYSPTTYDWFGWGTAKGVGVDDCPDYYGSGWQVYVDGVAFDLYFCDSPYATLAGNAQDQTFQVHYSTCPFFPYTVQWTFRWAGVYKTCRANSFTSAAFYLAGSESIGTLADQNLDVHWETMKYLNSSYAWVNWGAGLNCFDPPYRVRVINNTDFWTELP